MKAFRVFRPRLAPVLVLALAPLFVACEEPDWNDVPYVTSKLQSADPIERQVALSKIVDMPRDQQAKYKDLLIKMYVEKLGDRTSIINILIPMRDAAAKDAYVVEMETNDGGKAAAAADALGTLKATDAIAKMIATLEATDDTATKQGIMRGFAQMPDKQMVQALTRVLALDADNNPIALHAYACEILGEIAEQDPTAISEPTRQAMVRGIFLSNMKKQNVAKECGLAVQKVGATAIPDLVKVFRGERQDIVRLMLTYDLPINFTKGVATNSLTGLQAAEAVALFAEEIGKPKEIPKLLKGNAAVSWAQTEGRAHSEMLRGLGDLGDPKALDILGKVLLGEKNKELASIMDFAIETQLRQDAATAIRAIGDRSAAAVLLKAAQSAVINDLEKLAKQNPTMPPGRRFTFQLTNARAYANLAGADAEAGLKKLSDESKSKFFRAYMASLLVMPQLYAECNGKGADAEKAKCYASKLKDKNEMVREKAAFELRRLPSAAAAPELAAALSVPFLDTREFIEVGVYRHPSKEALAAIDKILEDESSLTDINHKVDHHRLQLLRAWLKHKVK